MNGELKMNNDTTAIPIIPECQHNIEIKETSSQIVTYCVNCGIILDTKNKPPLGGY